MDQGPDHLKVGRWGEEIACRYLRKKGYQILERNFRNRWGELDIVCRKRECDDNNGYNNDYNYDDDNDADKRQGGGKKIVSFIKKLLHLRKPGSSQATYSGPLVFVEVKTLKRGAIDPEENMTHSKIKKLIRACEIYLSSHKLDLDSNWQIDVVAITLDQSAHKAQIAHYENAIY